MHRGSSLSDDFLLSPSSLCFRSLELNWREEVIEVPPISPYFLFNARWVNLSTDFSSSNCYRWSTCGSSGGTPLSGLAGAVPEFKCRLPVPPVCPCSLVPVFCCYYGVLAVPNELIEGLSFFLLLWLPSSSLVSSCSYFVSSIISSSSLLTCLSVIGDDSSIFMNLSFSWAWLILGPITFSTGLMDSLISPTLKWGYLIRLILTVFGCIGFAFLNMRSPSYSSRFLFF